MFVRKLRLQRGWSQEQLAQMSGLSTRTVQRIERNQGASLETLKSLAAVFDIPFSELEQETNMNVTEQHVVAGNSAEEEKIIEHVRDIKGFYQQLIIYVVGIFGLLVINLVVSPDTLWVKWPALGWGIGVFIHGINVFEWVNILGPKWEKKQIEKRLGRKL